MQELDALRDCYQSYLTYTRTLRRRTSPLAGALGFGGGPKDDPEHMRFYQQAQERAEALLAAAPSPQEAGEAVTLMLRAEEEHQDNDLAVWALMAAQHHAIPLIGLLEREDAGALLAWYQRRYPRRKRLPAQEEVLRALKAQAGRSF